MSQRIRIVIICKPDLFGCHYSWKILLQPSLYSVCALTRKENCSKV